MPQKNIQLRILIIENNSEDQATFDYYEKLKKQDERIRVETWKMDDARHSEKHGFNYTLKFKILQLKKLMENIFFY